MNSFGAEKIEQGQGEHNQSLLDGIEAWNTALQEHMLDDVPVGSWLAIGLGEDGVPRIATGTYNALCEDPSNSGAIIYMLNAHQLETREFRLPEIDSIEKYQ